LRTRWCNESTQISLRLEGAHLAFLVQVHGQDGLGHTATQEDWIADGGNGSRLCEKSP
jgi:hypothetical protein